MRFIVQQRDDAHTAWVDIVDEIFPAAPGQTGFLLPADRVSPYLGGAARQRHELRVVGIVAKGKVATRAVVVFPDGGDGKPVSLSLPWPNPAHDTVRVLAEIPAGVRGTLGIFDLKGRRVMERTLGAGNHLLEWNGFDSRGWRAASGTYIIRLEGSGPVVMRKVVLLN